MAAAALVVTPVSREGGAVIAVNVLSPPLPSHSLLIAELQARWAGILTR